LLDIPAMIKAAAGKPVLPLSGAAQPVQGGR